MSRTVRKPYTKSKRFDRTCRNHGSCPWCEGNRTHNYTKRLKAAEECLREAFQLLSSLDLPKGSIDVEENGD